MRFAALKPFWLTLLPPRDGDEESPNGVRVKFAPSSKAMRRKATRASQKLLTGIDFSDRARVLSDDEADALYAAGEVSSHVLIRLAILDQPEPEWDGVNDADGKPMPVTEQNVDILLANEEFFDAADALYVRPIALRELEKNGLSPSPDGTGGAKIQAGPIAKTAPRRARPARTKPTGSKPTMPRASGKS